MVQIQTISFIDNPNPPICQFASSDLAVWFGMIIFQNVGKKNTAIKRYGETVKRKTAQV